MSKKCEIADPVKLGFCPKRLERINEWMGLNVEKGRFSGSSALIARHGEIAHLPMVGQRSIEDGLAYERDTIVRIYSMTKMITSVGLMMLVERGLVHLDARVSDILPEFSKCHALIPGATSRDHVETVPAPTLHQLLTHTSGMSYGFNLGLLGELYQKNLPSMHREGTNLEGWVKQIAELPLAFAPGSAWEYSVGIDIIGRVIEVISGQPLEDYLRTEVFEPLGMLDTAFDIAGDKSGRLADCYTWTESNSLKRTDKAENSSYRSGNVGVAYGGGGLLSTLDDYFRFGEMVRRGGVLDGERLLAPSTLAFMRGNHLPGDIASMGPTSFAEMPMTGTGFGIGGAVILNPAQTRMQSSVGDFGWGGMASTYFWTDPVLDLTCIFFTQLIPSSTYPNRAEFKALVHGALVDA